MEALKDILAGSVAGASGILATQPLDIIRIRLATQNEAGGARVNSMGACARSILRAHGVAGFFRGMAAPLVANAPINATIFAVERMATRFLNDSGGHSSSESSARRIAKHLLAGGLSGLAQVPFSAPSELVKLQLQVDHGKKEPYTSSLHCARAIWSEHGIAGLFRGGVLTTFRDVSAFAIYFGAYHELKRLCANYEEAQRQKKRAGTTALPSAMTTAHAFASAPVLTLPSVPASTAALMLSGGFAGAASWFFTYPIDISKSLVQGLPLSTPAEQRSLKAVLKHNLQEEGGSWRFLWRGLTPTLVRGFVCSAVVFPVFEFTLSLLAARQETVMESQEELHNHR